MKKVIQITAEQIKQIMPKRIQDSHKGTYGSVLNLVSSPNMIGAGFLAAYSALKSGCGYSTIATLEALIPVFATMTPEIIYIPLKAYSSESALDLIKVIKSGKYCSLVIGCGLGLESSTVEFASEILSYVKDKSIKIVIDADALTILSKMGDVKLNSNIVLTPHPKELSGLLGMSVDKVQQDRVKAAMLACEKYNCNVVLKGHKTVIATPSDDIYINTTGNSALATAGSGDVLAGMIAGFVAQGANAVNSVLLGVYLHGLAGEIASGLYTEYSTTSKDVMNSIHLAIKDVLSY